MHPKGIPCLYCSTDMETAMKETLQHRDADDLSFAKKLMEAGVNGEGLRACARFDGHKTRHWFKA